MNIIRSTWNWLKNHKLRTTLILIIVYWLNTTILSKTTKGMASDLYNIYYKFWYGSIPSILSSAYNPYYYSREKMSYLTSFTLIAAILFPFTALLIAIFGLVQKLFSFLGRFSRNLRANDNPTPTLSNAPESQPIVAPSPRSTVPHLVLSETQSHSNLASGRASPAGGADLEREKLVATLTRNRADSTPLPPRRSFSGEDLLKALQEKVIEATACLSARGSPRADGSPRVQKQELQPPAPASAKTSPRNQGTGMNALATSAEPPPSTVPILPGVTPEQVSKFFTTKRDADFRSVYLELLKRSGGAGNNAAAASDTSSPSATPKPP